MCNERVSRAPRATSAFGYNSSPSSPFSGFQQTIRLFFFSRFQSGENRAKKDNIAVEHQLAVIHSPPPTRCHLLTAIYSPVYIDVNGF